MKRTVYSYPYLLWMGLFIVVPLGIIVYYAFTTTSGGVVSFSLENIKNAFDPIYMAVLLRSILLSVVSTLICLVIGYPAAAIIASRNFKKGSLIIILFVIPMWMNFLLRTYAWINLLDDNGIIASSLRFLGFTDVSLLYNKASIVVGLVYNYLPFMILPIYSVMVKIEPHLLEAAEDLGATPAQVFRKVIFPLSMPGIITGITMVFMPAVTTFAVSRLLGGSNFMMYGDAIEQQFFFLRDWHFGATLSLVMMVMIILSMMVLKRYDAQKDGGLMW